MPRFKLTLEYDGTPFVGWQRQTNGLAVQEVVESAIFALSGETVTIRGAGRTDAGVHASAQVAHVDLTREWRVDVLRDALNAHMKPRPVAVLSAELVPDTFDARFSAVRRHYIYRLRNRRSPLTLTAGREWLIKRKLDVHAMQAGAALLLGMHDFSTFRDSECQAESPIRTLEQLDVVRDGEIILIRAAARSFLHRQVRSMVGSLEHVGSGRWSPRDLRDALDAKDRARCGMVAPADGLYLVGVDYEGGLEG
ncbi:MAG: tRNA pseudouridine(38-40) synthase TruA [Beijerinckiaceae bacterium]|jgi:tRNA pseudouridine38-40 synthase